MGRKINLKKMGPVTMHRISYFLLSAGILLTMGCGSQHHTAVTSESIPSEQERIKAIDESKRGGPTGIAKDSTLSQEDLLSEGEMPPRQRAEGEVSESQMAEDQRSRPGSSELVEEAPLHVIEQQPKSDITKDSTEPLSAASGGVPAKRKGKTKSAPLGEGAAPEDGPALESSQIAKLTPIPFLEQPIDVSKLPKTLSDVFFDYDQSKIRSDAIKALETNAKVLIGRYPGKKVVIQGHCDERGTLEYNIVLGERRAQAVKNYLVDLGVPEKDLQIISYGKEKPFCLDHTYKCWQQNRRGHFVMN